MLHALVVAGGAVGHLLLEALALDERAVQLGVRVAELLLVDEELESLGEARVAAVPLGERGHDARVVHDERRVDAVGLDVVADERVEHPRDSVRLGQLNLRLLDEVLQERQEAVVVEVVREGLAGALLQLGNHLDSSERRPEVDAERRALRGRVVDGRAARDARDELAEQVLREVHEVVVVRVGPVELDARELGVVRHVDALVAELAAELVDAVEAADDEHLEVELRGDAQEHVEVEVVVVRLERAGGRAAGDDVHHGRLNLEEAAGVQVGSEEGDDLRARLEDLPGVGVHDEVEVALAVALLLVLEAVVVLREHVEARREERHALRDDGELAGLRAGRAAADADDVAAVEDLRDLAEGLLAALVLVGLRHDLDLDALAVEVVEAELGARAADGHDAAGEVEDVRELLADGQRVVFGLEGVERHRELELVRVGAVELAELADHRLALLRVGALGGLGGELSHLCKCSIGEEGGGKIVSLDKGVHKCTEGKKKRVIRRSARDIQHTGLSGRG